MLTGWWEGLQAKGRSQIFQRCFLRLSKERGHQAKEAIREPNNEGASTQTARMQDETFFCESYSRLTVQQVEARRRHLHVGPAGGLESRTAFSSDALFSTRLKIVKEYPGATDNIIGLGCLICIRLQNAS